MEKAKIVGGVIAAHAPGLALMAYVHWTWAAAMIPALLLGIIGGCIASNRPAALTTLGIKFVPERDPDPPIVNKSDEMKNEITAEELVGV